jgi:Na+-transporting methylmalonyl-CoA/oxaloacetate decarboxylase gamma subunit
VNDVALGLQVTGIGMALVFLTLIIVMFAIWLLSWAFRPRSGETVQPAKPARPRPRMEGPPSDSAAIAAAIAVAIARGRQQRGGAVRRPSPSISYAYDGDDIVGEVVYIAQIEDDSGAWKSQARLKAMQ